MQRVRFSFRSVLGLAGVVALALAASSALAGDGAVLTDGPITFFGVSTSRTDDGVRVTKVIRGTAAEAAGMRRGDVILEFDGHPVANSNELLELVRVHEPGDAIEVRVSRDGDRESLTVELGERPGGLRLQLDDEYWVWSPHMRGRVHGEIGLSGHHDTKLEDVYLCPQDENCGFSSDRIWYRADCVGRGCETYAVRYHDKPMLGVDIVQTTPELSRHLGGETGGVLIGKVMPGSPADEGGIEVGDLIVAVDGEATDDREALRRAIRAGAGGDIDVEVIRDGRSRRVLVTIEESGRSGPLD